MANRWVESISRFNEYLCKAKGISDSERAETERHIANFHPTATRLDLVISL